MKVGIIIPYKTDRGWLKYARESVKRQTYEGPIELYEEKSDNTAGYNFNRGVEKALADGCDLIRFLCEDDTLTINSIEDSVEYFRVNQEVDFIHSKAINRFQSSGAEQEHVPELPFPTLEQMLRANRLHGGSVVYRAKCFFEWEHGRNLIDQDLWTGEEYEFNMRLMKQGFVLGYLPTFTYIYRRHSKQKSLGNTDAGYQALRKQQMEIIRQSIREL